MANWIYKLKPGTLTATARRAGEINAKGRINKSWIAEEAKHGLGKTRKRAIAAQTLAKLARKKALKA